MSGFLEKFNTDDVFLRNLMIAFLRSLNEKLTYYQINDQQQVLEVFIPFYPSMTGDEPFLQDFFIEYQNCLDGSIMAEGNYDVIPRGIVRIGPSSIDPSGLTNKYTRMNYTKESLEGEMKTYSSYTNSLPVNLSFEITIKLDTLLDTFKVYQSVLTTFYKTYSFSFEYGGFRIPCQVGFPDNYENTKQLEFSYANNPTTIDLNFSVTVETYFPEKDLSTERFRGNLMQAGIKMNEKFASGISNRERREIL